MEFYLKINQEIIQEVNKEEATHYINFNPYVPIIDFFIINKDKNKPGFERLNTILDEDNIELEKRVVKFLHLYIIEGITAFNNIVLEQPPYTNRNRDWFSGESINEEDGSDY